MAGGSIILPKAGNESPEQQQIAEILGPDELRTKNPFQSVKDGHLLSTELRSSISFKLAPHIDQLVLSFPMKAYTLRKHLHK